MTKEHLDLFRCGALNIPQGRRQELGPLGLSGTSLHAKTFVVDDRRLFVGSFNFDPRSVWLNCENG